MVNITRMISSECKTILRIHQAYEIRQTYNKFSKTDAPFTEWIRGEGRTTGCRQHKKEATGTTQAGKVRTNVTFTRLRITTVSVQSYKYYILQARVCITLVIQLA